MQEYLLGRGRSWRLPEQDFQERDPHMPRPTCLGLRLLENMDPTLSGHSPWRACPLGIPVQCILSAELWGQGRGSGTGAASDKTEPVIR